MTEQEHTTAPAHPPRAGTVALVHVIQTCVTCPAQWDAWDTEYRYYYLRYRHGHGTVERTHTKDDYEAGHAAELVAAFETGDNHAAADELPDFLRYAGIELAPHARVEEYDWGDEDADDEDPGFLRREVDGIPIAFWAVASFYLLGEYHRMKAREAGK